MNDVSATEGTYPPPHNNDAADEAPNLALTDVVKEDATLGESTDPLRLYLKKLGSTTLLSRDGEVAIAKRIEDAENAVLTALLNSPLAVRTILKLGPALKAGTVRITNLVKHADDAFEPFDEDQEKDRFLKLLDRVRRAHKKELEMQRDRANAGGDGERRRADARIDAHREKTVEILRDMRLSKKLIDQIVAELKQVGDRMGKASSRSEARRVASEMEVDVKETVDTCRRIKTAERAIEKAKAELIEANLR
ncbi:MAG TPA: sigma-70 factor domain-containing protein, partial [Polyangiaceae bacterium]|nr:sigma-70 factor domain-containing protein [Polyangiaceae bacterium]